MEGKVMRKFLRDYLQGRNLLLLCFIACFLTVGFCLPPEDGKYLVMVPAVGILLLDALLSWNRFKN
jgi:hypothetical protein